jgi:hypothetical protein
MQILLQRHPCSLCAGKGLVRLGSLCARCEGAGHVRRLSLGFPVVNSSKAILSDGPWWSRLVVVTTVVSAGRTLATGVTAEGLAITTYLKPKALEHARCLLFEQRGWEP